MPDHQPNDDGIRCCGRPKPYHMSDVALKAMRDAASTNRPLIIIDKGRSYRPLQELLGQGSTQFQFDHPTTIDPSKAGG